MRYYYGPFYPVLLGAAGGYPQLGNDGYRLNSPFPRIRFMNDMR